MLSNYIHIHAERWTSEEAKQATSVIPSRRNVRRGKRPKEKKREEEKANRKTSKQVTTICAASAENDVIGVPRVATGGLKKWENGVLSRRRVEKVE